MHTIITGQTGSGKSTWAKAMAARRVSQGGAVLVLDPNFDDWGKGCKVFWDRVVFLRAAYKARNCLLIIDEGGEALSEQQQAMKSLATRSRHLGHDAVFIVHRAKDIRPIYRTNAGQIFSFHGSPEDGKILAQNWGSKFNQVSELKVGEFIWKKGIEAAVRTQHILD